jgi:two-component system aerobic respiration control sensor histidine kinase ArcB
MTDNDKDQKIASLQAEIETLKTIISIMPGNVYWKDTEGRHLGCNNNVAKLLKLNSPAEAIGKTDADLIGPPYSDILRQIDLEVMNNKKELRVEEYGPNVNGGMAHFLTQKTPLYDNSGEVIGILGISLDITVRKEIEEKLKIAKKKAEAANRAKSKFLAMVSHELRTPLTSILGFVGFLKDDNCTNEDRKHYIQYIIDSGSYLLALINNLLDYNKLETNKFELSPHVFNLKNLTNDIINMLSGAAKQKQLDFSLEYDERAPENIISDSHVLRQILVNLVGNAIKFTESGHVVIRVRCKSIKNQSAELRIAIEDSGPGIPAEQQEFIFKRFYQLENIYTRNKSLMGTGLGLSIVKKLVKLLGSKIEITSKLNEGTTFYFSTVFPIAATEHVSISNSESIVLEKKSKPHTYRALLVEDDTLIQIVHRQMLEELDCKVDIAECASKAITMLHQSYDIIFVDIGLPDMNGFELIKMMREKYLLNANIPIIALTGYSEENERLQCLLAGANQVAVKPISKAALGILIEQHI